MEKSPIAGSRGALNPTTEKIKTLDSRNTVLITGCSGGLFCLAGCLLNGGEFLMDMSQHSVYVHGACLRGSAVFLSAAFELFKNKGKPAASYRAQKQMVKLKSKDLFWVKAVGLSWNLLHMLL